MEQAVGAIDDDLDPYPQKRQDALRRHCGTPGCDPDHDHRHPGAAQQPHLETRTSPPAKPAQRRLRSPARSDTPARRNPAGNGPAPPGVGRCTRDPLDPRTRSRARWLLTWYRSATRQATATLQQEGHDWREIELGADDLATLISRLDALAFDWENGKVSDEVWHTAWKLTYEVASAAFRGALIDETNYEFRIARDYIDAARDALGTSGRVDELPAPQQA